ncbi:glycosyl hydrolase family 18 [Apiospora phragmitis]|uniref:chitinase n=1 Tax=Apiospora phragmitis TaxID=2905665 RepID=A0ABR1TTT2_9PEZI
MKVSSSVLAGLVAFGAAADAGCAQQQLRNMVYFDQYHTAILPPRDVTAGITHVVMSFANSSLFATTANKSEDYKPFMEVSKVRAMFDNGTQVGVALGGWGDTDGFGAGAKTEASRKQYARKIAAMATTLGFDFIDIDWKYPGGNGVDYKQIPNSKKEIKNAIKPRALSIAVPGKAQDMIAYTPEHAPAIFAAVDMVNVMAYDLMNRRDNATAHHTAVHGSLAAVDAYLALGCPAAKLNLGLAFYAKYFQTAKGVDCSGGPIGCPILPAENATDGSDLGTSGAITFEAANVSSPPPPTNLITSKDQSCGTGTAFTCQGLADAGCCSQYGFCGSTPAHCGAGCQAGFGTCEGPQIGASFVSALKESKTDEVLGGQWWWDASNELFWTLDTVPLMQRKFKEIVAARGLGGIFAWSLGEDSYDWSHLKAMREGVEGLSKASKK